MEGLFGAVYGGYIGAVDGLFGALYGGLHGGICCLKYSKPQ